jgi:hypothetical protein
MSTYSTVPAVVNPVYDPIAEAERITAELSTHIDQMVQRMQKAMDLLAEACGAWHCEHCGEWTTETIQVANYSDEMGYEMESHCARCVPAGVEVN